MTFERTEDLHLVREILTDPRCWRRMTRDGSPAIDQFQPKLRNDLVYVVALLAGRVLALFVLRSQHDPAACEVHFCFRPEAWGAAEEIARLFVGWIWRETSIDELRGPVPGYNRLALSLAKKAGFRETSRAIAEVPKHGKLYDRILLEATRPRYRREAASSHESKSTSRSLPPRP